jgi:hypothetical protein
MKTMYTYSIVALMTLTGCQSHVSKYDESMQEQQNAVAFAQGQVVENKPACTKGKQLNALTPKEYLRATKCINNLIEQYVVPVTPYPESLRKLLYTNLENAALYSQGEISYEQVEARSDMAVLLMNQENGQIYNSARSELGMQDAAERANLAKSLQGFEPQRPVYTTCSHYGRTTQCRSQ